MKDGAQGGTRTLHGAREPKEQPSEAGEHLCEMLPSSDSTPPPPPGPLSCLLYHLRRVTHTCHSNILLMLLSPERVIGVAIA